MGYSDFLSQPGYEKIKKALSPEHPRITSVAFFAPEKLRIKIGEVPIRVFRKPVRSVEFRSGLSGRIAGQKATDI